MGEAGAKLGGDNPGDAGVVLGDGMPCVALGSDIGV